MMRITAAFLILIVSLLGGCRSLGAGYSGSDHYEETSRRIERLETQTASILSTGTNIKIVVNKLSANVSDYTTLDALWRYTDRHVVIANRPDAYARSGVVIGVATDNFNAQLNIAKGRLKSSEDATLFIVVADGSTGIINIGQEIVVPLFFYADRYYRSIDYEFRHAGRFVKVTPRVLPSGAMEIQVSPGFSKFLSAGGDIELTQLTTTVIVQSGQTIVIGGGNTSGQDVGTALFSYSKWREEGKTLITLTPTIQ
jgi:hypothetical protein